jgi:hypothetical protein
VTLLVRRESRGDGALHACASQASASQRKTSVLARASSFGFGHPRDA